MLFLVFSFKVLYPERVIILRGPQEEASINRIYGFYDECKRLFNVKFWKLAVDVMNYLPAVALVGEQVMVVASGISPEMELHETEPDVTFEQLFERTNLKIPCRVPDEGSECIGSGTKDLDF